MSDVPPPFGPFDPPPPLGPGGPFQAPTPFEPGSFESAGGLQPPAPPGAATEAPAPPPAELRPGGAGETPLSEYLWRRLEGMERELQASQRQALEAHALLTQQEELKVQVESQLKLLSGQVRREKIEKEVEEEKQRAHGRVDALEKRLDEMHHTWAQLLREAIGSRQGANEDVLEELRQLRGDLGAVQHTVGGLPEIMPQIHELKAQIPAGTARWEEDARRLEGAVSSRLAEIERRMSQEMELQRDRVADLQRERAAIEQALQTQRQQNHQEFMKERLSLLSQFNEQSTKLQEALEKVLGARDGEGAQLKTLKGLIERAERMATEPKHAKDEILRELEEEKRELLNALKERTAQFQAFTTERRDVERSLGESLLKFQRELDEARARHVGLEGRTADLQMQVQAGEARLLAARRESETKDERFAALAAERDELARALALEAEKVRESIQKLAGTDQGWAERVEQSGRAASEERQRRLQLEGELADLRARMQTLADQLARALQEKDLVAHESTSWKQEREQLQAALRKKDDMVAMLSSTLKNLLKK
ncbi:MAG: hypothetical protein HY554_05875 [Elusimicrobia bacterium]|nr:hypothetical protein [Elusimicrobiota bacterium]